MRKRQWKKILSLVLAIAMVFTMNTSIFAAAETGVDVTSEENAAQPEGTTEAAPAAEEPSTEESGTEAEVPATDETTEPAEGPVNVEEPAAETPAEPAEPVADEGGNEQAAGTDVTNGSKSNADNWTADGSANDDATWGDATITVKGSKAVTLTAAAGADTLTVTLNKPTTGTTTSFTLANLTNLTNFVLYNAADKTISKLTTTAVSIGTDAADTVTYKILKVDTTTGLANDGTEINFAQGKLVTNKDVYSTGATYTKYTKFEDIETAVNSGNADSGVDFFVVDTSAGTAKKVNIKKATNGEMTAFTADNLTVGMTTVSVKEGTSAEGQEIKVNVKGGAVVDTKAGSSSAVNFTGLTKKTTYEISRRTASSNSAKQFASPVWTTPYEFTTTEYEKITTTGQTVNVDSLFDITNTSAEGTLTVSGVTLTVPQNKRLVGQAVSMDGIFTVTLSAASAAPKLTGGSTRPVSFNAPEGTGYIYNDANSNLPGSKISFYGKGTVSFDEALTNGPVEIFHIDSTVKLSANNADKAILVSENSTAATTKYYASVYEKDAPVTVSKTEKVKVYIAENDTDDFDESEQNNTVTNKSSATYVISDNMTTNKLVAANQVIDLTKASSSAALYYGKTVFYADNTTLTTNLKFQTLKDRYPNNMPTLTFFPGNVKPDQAEFETPDGITVSEWIFSVSTSSVAPAVGQFFAATGTNVLSGTHLAGGESALKPNTTYNVFAISSNGAPSGLYYSEAKLVGSFTTKAEQKLEIAWNGSPIYYGGQDTNESDAIKAGVLGLTFGSTGYTITESGNGTLLVKDPDNENAIVGWINAYVFTKAIYDDGSNAVNIRKAKTEADTEFTSLIGTAENVAAEATASNAHDSSAANTLKNLVSANGYYVKAFFKPNTSAATDEEVAASYSEVSSNVISFNVIPAPVEAQAQEASAPIKKYLTNSNFKVAPSIKYVNKITGKAVESDEFTGTPVYTTAEGIIYDANSKVSYNSAGSHSYSISPNKIAPKTVGKGAKYTLANADLKAGTLSIFGEVTTSSFTLTLSDVYYGENATSIIGNATVTYNNGADSAAKVTKLTASNIEFYKSISANGTVSAASPKITGDIEAQDAGTTVYAAVTVPEDSIVASNAKDTQLVQSFTIAARPVNVVIQNAEKFSSYRNIEIKGTVSGGKANADATLTEVTSIGGKTHHFAGTVPVLSENATFDMSYVDITTSGNYAVPLAGIKFTKDGNFSVNEAKGYYVIKPAWYGYFILEYGGHDKKSTSKKTIYKVTKYTQTDGEKTANNITWELPKEIASENALRTFNGAIDGKNDKVVSFEAKAGSKYNNAVIDGNVTVEELLAKKVTTLDKYGDVYFYAVVQAYATEDVYVQSITPKTYNGNKHNVKDDAIKAANGAVKDIDLVVMDQSKGQELKLGTDYTVTVKNNVNASVKYDNSTSVSNNLGCDHR